MADTFDIPVGVRKPSPPTIAAANDDRRTPNWRLIVALIADGVFWGIIGGVGWYVIIPAIGDVVSFFRAAI